MVRRVGLGCLAIGTWLCLAPPTWAATCTFTGSTSTSWNDASNWSGCGGVTPTSSDTASITTDDKSCVMDVSATVDTIVIGGGGSYNETLTINSGITLTVDGGATPGATAIDVKTDGRLTVNGAVIASVDAAGYTNAGIITVNSGGTLKTKGGLAGAGTYTFNSGSTVVYDKGSSDTVAALTYANLQVQPSANSVTHTFAAGTVTVNGTLTIGNGTNTTVTVTAATNSTILDVNGDVTINANTTLTAHASNSFTVTGSWTTSGTFTANSGTVTFDGTATGKTINPGSSSFYNLIFSGSGGAWSPLTNTLTVTNDLTMTAGTLDNSNGSASVTVNGSVAGTAGIINLTSGTFTQQLPGTSKNFGTTSGTTNWAFNNLTFSRSSGTPTITAQSGGSGNITIAGTLTIGTSTTLDASSRTWTLSGSGTPFVNNGTFTRSTSTVTYTSSSGANVAATSINYYKLTIDGSGQNFVLDGGVTIENNLTVTAGSFSLNEKNVTIGNNTANGSITGAGTIYCGNGNNTCSAGTVTLDPFSATVNVTQSSGGYTFYNLDLGGSGSDTIATGGTITVKNILTINGNDTLSAGTSTIVLAGSGTSGSPLIPLAINATGTFTPGTSTIKYTANDATNNTTKVTATTYANLEFAGGASNTFILGTASSQTITIGVNAGDTASLTVTSGIVDAAGPASAYNPNITINGTGAVFALTFSLSSGTTWTKGTGTITFSSNAQQSYLDLNGSTQDIGTVVVNNSSAAGVLLTTGMKATSVTINASKKLDISNRGLTLTGSGTPLTITGTLTENTSSTVEFAGTGTTTVNARTYGGSLKVSGSGGTFNAGGTIVVTSDLTVTAGTLAMGANNLTVGSTSVTNSGSIKVASGQSLTQTSSNTTTMKSSASGANCIGSNGASCVGTAGTITLGSLTIGDASTTLTTTFGGTSPSMTVAGTLNLTTNAIFDGGSGTVTLSSTGTPITRSGTFTRNTSTVTYTSGSGVTALSSAAMTGSNAFYNLTINGTGTFTAGVAVEATNAVTVTAGTLALGTNNLTVGTTGGSGTGSITGAGTITSSSSSLTILQGTGNLGGGTYTFYNLDLGDGSSTRTTTAAGNFTVSNLFRILASHTFNGSSRTITLSGSGTSGSPLIPFVVNGTFTVGTSTIKYTGTDTTKVTATTYANLECAGGSGTFILGTGTGQTITIGANAGDTASLALTSGTVNASTYNPDIAINGTGAAFGLTLLLLDGTTWTKGTGTITFSSSSSQGWSDSNSSTKQDMGAVVINNSHASGVIPVSSVKATSVVINASKKLNISGYTLTLTGSSTPLTITGTLTENTSSTVEFAGTGTTTVNARTYGGNLTINGSGGTFNAGGTLTVTCDVTVAAGTLAMGTNNLTVGSSTSGCGDLDVSGTFTQSASGTTTVLGNLADLGIGGSGTATFYNLTIGDGSTATSVPTAGDFTVTNVLTQASGGVASTFNSSNSTITLAGSGTPWVRNNKLHSCNSSTIKYTSSSGATVEGVTGGSAYCNLTIQGSGTFTPNGNLTAVGLVGIQVTSGTFEVSTYTVTANIKTAVNGGTLSMTGSGGILKVGSAGGLEMTSGSIVTQDVATAPVLTTTGTEGTNFYPVNFTGGTLNVAEWDIRSVASIQVSGSNYGAIRIGSGVTVTKFDQVTYSSFQTTANSDALLDVTSQTANLLSHVFPASWSSGECNVRSNTSGTVTMWDWTGGFGGEENDCDNGGEVVWKGGVGGSQGSGTSGYPAIY